MTETEKRLAAFAEAVAEAGRDIGAEHIMVVAVGSAEDGGKVPRAAMVTGALEPLLATLGAMLGAQPIGVSAAVQIIALGARPTGTVQ